MKKKRTKKGIEDEEEGREGDKDKSVSKMNDDDLTTEFFEVLDSNVEHFFVDANPSDRAAIDEVVGLEEDGESVESITQFLIFPTVVARVNPCNCDSIIDLNTSIILPSKQYITRVVQLKESKVQAIRQKEIA